MAREYFNAYHSYVVAMSELSDAECGRLFRALLEYSATGIVSELRGNERIIFPMMAQQIDREKRAYEDKCNRNRQSAGRRWDANASNRMRMDQVACKEEEKDKEKEEKKEKGAKAPEKKIPTPPLVDQELRDTYALLREKTDEPFPSAGTLTDVKDWCDTAGHELVRAAINHSFDRRKEKKPWTYIKKIVKDWYERGMRTQADVDAYLESTGNAKDRAARAVPANKALEYEQRQYSPGELDAMFERF